MSDDNRPRPQTLIVQRVFQQAPWRTRTQATSLVLAAVVIVAAIGALYLAQASRTAAAGRRLQDLEEQRQVLELQNAQLRAEIAALQSVPRLIREAEARGFRTASAAEVQYMQMEGVTAAQLQPIPVEEGPDPLADAPQEAPTYDETLRSWLFERLTTVRERLNPEETPNDE